MADLLLTYIVPVYNTAQYVERCLDAIMNQALPDDAYEVLVVDDGSTDGSREVIEAVAREYPQVRLLCQENQGVSAARNLALDQAKGRFVQFVDSDDFLMDDMMAPLVQQAADEDLDVLIFNYNWTDAAGHITRAACDSASVQPSVMTGVEYLHHHTMTPYVWRYLISRDFLNRNGWRFDRGLIVCEDGELIVRFMLKANRVAASDSAPYCYVNRSDSAMHNQDRDHLMRRILSQIDSAISIDETIRNHERETGVAAPVSVRGRRNVYLYFSMTKALTVGCVDEALERMRQAGLYPFPCVGPEADYYGAKWRVIHALMMHPHLWKFLSRIYRAIKR